MHTQELNWIADDNGGRMRVTDTAHKELTTVLDGAPGKAVRVRIAGFG